MSTAKPLIYLAGPYTNPDPVLNTHLAVKTALLRGRPQAEALATALVDPRVEASPLYGNAAAVAAGGELFEAIALRLKKAAIAQYLRQREAYRREWAAILPFDFDRLAVEAHFRASSRKG